MAEIRRLARPPITEALVDFRVKARPDLKATDFDQLRADLSSTYPTVVEQRGIEMLFEVKGTVAAPSVKDLPSRGLLFGSPDGRDNVQFRVDGFTFNRLTPYTSWDDIFPKAMAHWKKYVEIARPQAITRVAVRYLNAFELTSPITALRDVFKAPPAVPEELPQFASHFQTMVTIHDPARMLAANVGQSMQSTGGQGRTQVVIDIDAFRQGELPSNDDELSRIFADLRSYKNQIFFNLLTEAKLKEFE